MNEPYRLRELGVCLASCRVLPPLGVYAREVFSWYLFCERHAQSSTTLGSPHKTRAHTHGKRRELNAGFFHEAVHHTHYCR